MNYFFKRILWLIPTFFFLSLLIFGISLSAPYLADAQLEEYASRSSQQSFYKQETRLDQFRHNAGTFSPAFYMTLKPFSLSDTLYKISDPKVRASLKKWALDLGKWQPIDKLYQSIIKESLINPDRSAELYALFDSNDLDQLKEKCDQMDLKPISQEVEAEIDNRSSILNFIPSISWYGSDNRYHHWISGLLSFELGNSIVNNRPISHSIANAMQWTLSIGLLSLLIALLIAIPLAAKAAENPDGLLDRFCNLIFFALYSIPVFWMATLLIIFFASVHHFQWFPSFGIGELNEGMNGFEIFLLRAKHLALPLICWTYGSMAVIYRHMRSKLKEEVSKDYILTARSKGLSYSKVIWLHAFRNSSFPLITLLGAVIPAIIGGSFVIESVFSIPGMGKLTLDAFLQRDYPLIFNISFLACVITVLGVFLADLAYHFADPRLKTMNHG
jgi:peptide/nickel transport system permease protein